MVAPTRVALPGIWPAARHFGAFGGFVGACCGILYSVGGLLMDLATTGVNVGTVLALNALWGMPLLGWVVGALMGFLYWPIYRRLRGAWGGGATR